MPGGMKNDAGEFAGAEPGIEPFAPLEFGPDRVIDTPISELAFTGAAFGAAVKGMRPVVEIMFGDFLGSLSTRS